jgi:hypothetical protein
VELRAAVRAAGIGFTNGNVDKPRLFATLLGVSATWRDGDARAEQVRQAAAAAAARAAAARVARKQERLMGSSSYAGVTGAGNEDAYALSGMAGSAEPKQRTSGKRRSDAAAGQHAPLPSSADAASPPPPFTMAEFVALSAAVRRLAEVFGDDVASPQGAAFLRSEGDTADAEAIESFLAAKQYFQALGE